jgi:hypothetical protein
LLIAGQLEEQLTQLGEELKTISSLVHTLLDTSKKDTKQLDQLLKNSSTDCKLLSSCNTSLQSMKVSILTAGPASQEQQHRM